MSAPEVTDLEASLRTVLGQATRAPEGPSGVAILVSDATMRRVLEGAANHIEALPTILLGDLDSFRSETLARFEMIVADDSLISSLREMLLHRADQEESVNPALISVCARAEVSGGDTLQSGFDGRLSLPMQPAEVAAQLSLLLYAHRAYARQYQTAMEELHLNRRIFRSVTSGISVASTAAEDLPLVYVNPAFEVMTGYSLEEVEGKNCRFLQGAERDQPAIVQLRAAIADEREVKVLLKNFRKDGSSFWNELSLSPIRNREGHVTHFVGIQQDVTARVEFESALRESEKLAAVGRLASAIAHEINNPLESVMNLLYLGQQTLARAEQPTTETISQARQFLTLAEKELQRVSQITTQSLRFYRQSTRPATINAADLIDSVLDLYEGRLSNAEVRIVRRDRPSGTIVGLDSEIRQVLNNLVRNAIDAMQAAGGGRLLVRSHAATDTKSGRRGIRITVADTGSGISLQTMKNLYRPFFTTKGISGTGLGLWISSEIVTRHQGTLRVRSRQAGVSGGAGGTVFQLFLPADWAAVETAE